MRIRRRSGRRGGLCCFENAHLRVSDGIGVVIGVHLFYISLALFEVEMLDVILLPAVNVDGFLVKKNERAGKIYFADDIRRASDIDDDEIVAGDRAKADGIG